MQKKKPDIFLGITVGMLVLAAVLCLVILFAQKSAPAKNDANNNGDPAAPIVSDEVIESGDATKPSDSDHQTPSDQETTDPDNPNVPVDVKAIDDVSLKAALDDCLSGLPNDWQVVVMDPIVGTEVDSYINCKGVNDLMKADQMLPVFIMATAFQKVADGALTEDQILDDVKAMIVQGDRAAADRLTEAVGGKEAVKKFAEKDFGLQAQLCDRPADGQDPEHDLPRRAGQQGCLLPDAGHPLREAGQRGNRSGHHRREHQVRLRQLCGGQGDPAGNPDAALLQRLIQCAKRPHLRALPGMWSSCCVRICI